MHKLLFLLSSSTKLLALQQPKQLHAQITIFGFQQHHLFIPKLITSYLAINFPQEAQTVAENSNILHPLPWNLLISYKVTNGLFTHALSLYQKMASKGIKPDVFTYPSVLKACGENRDIEFGRIVHNSIEVNCVEFNLYVYNGLISMYGKFNEVDVARKVFDRMLEKDNVSWNAMIGCYASNGFWDEAFEIFERTRADNIEVNFITWNTISGGCLRIGKFRVALDLLSNMLSCGTRLDPVAMVIGLTACSHLGVVKRGKEIHGLAFRFGYDGLENIRNALITMYSRCKDVRRADVLFRSMEVKSIITWNSMLSGHTHLDRWDEASLLFREMLRTGVKPNYVTIASVLPLCARVANLQHGKEFHGYILRHAEFDECLLVWNALVDMYARSGKIVEGKRLFRSMSERDEVTYTSLIAGYGMQGEGKVALELFDEMVRGGLIPDHVCMVAVLSACSHSGLVTEGRMLFGKMQSVYRITPRLEHFACMVDLYGRAGLLNEASEVIREMPYDPTPAMWATLLGACRIYMNSVVGEWAAEKLLETRPPVYSGYYVLIANMYAVAGCWSKLAKVRTFMRDLGVRKTPGCAWVDVGTGFLTFVVEDVSSSQAREIYSLLDGLNELMKDNYSLSKDDIGSDEEVYEE